MTECEEIAGSMLDLYHFAKCKTFDETREFVRKYMPEEGEVVLDNVAYALWKSETKEQERWENNGGVQK